MNRQKRRLWRCAVLWMTVWLLLCGTVHAAGGTLTLRYAFDGVAFSIYRVAEPTAAGYALTGPFDDCRVRLPRPEDGASVWKDAAETLPGYAARKAAAQPGRYPRRASHVCGTGARTASGSGGLPHTEWKNVYPGYFAGGGHRWGKCRGRCKVGMGR